MSRCGTRPLWSHDETIALLSIWEEKEIQDALNKSMKDYRVYEVIASKLSDMGYQRTPTQCHVKVKNLKAEYNATKNPFSPCRRQPKYGLEVLEKILGPKHEPKSTTHLALKEPSYTTEVHVNDDDDPKLKIIESDELELTNGFKLGASQSSELSESPSNSYSTLSDSSDTQVVVGGNLTQPSQKFKRKDNFSDQLPHTSLKKKKKPPELPDELRTLKSVMQSITHQFLQYQEAAEERFYMFERERMHHEAEMEESRMKFFREESERHSQEENFREIKTMQLLENILLKFQSPSHTSDTTTSAQDMCIVEIHEDP